MTKEKELLLLDKVYLGDTKALTELLKDGVGLAVDIASKYTKDTEELLHLVDAAMMGYLKAIDKYKSSEGRGVHKFSTYASYYMIQNVEKQVKSR